MVKTLHVCEYDDGIEMAASQSASHHHSGHDADNCPVCHFTFSTFNAVETLVIAAVVTVLLRIFVRVYTPMVLRRATVSLSLRAPPCAVLG
ncbi:MAG TPA: DUF2946 family protein [Prevotella sp.]